VRRSADDQRKWLIKEGYLPAIISELSALLITGLFSSQIYFLIITPTICRVQAVLTPVF
jgi:hypothetical protein